MCIYMCIYIYVYISIHTLYRINYVSSNYCPFIRLSDLAFCFSVTGFTDPCRHGPQTLLSRTGFLKTEEGFLKPSFF